LVSGIYAAIVTMIASSAKLQNAHKKDNTELFPSGGSLLLLPVCSQSCRKLCGIFAAYIAA
jgi:hypothetical protein